MVHGLAARPATPASRPTVIMDAGLSTEENIAWLGAHGYDWITVQRERRERPPTPADAVCETPAGDAPQAWKPHAEDLEDSAEDEPERDESVEQKAGERERQQEDPGPDEARLWVWSQRRQARDQAILERMGRVKERHTKVARQYEIKVRPAEKKQGKPRLAAAVTLRRNPQHEERSAQAGCYLLRTSHAAWDTECLVQTYWQLADIEATFRSLKSEAGLRPVYHRKPERVWGHLFIAVLAYHAIHLLRRRLKAAGIHASWARLQSEDGSWIETRQDTRPDARAAAIAAALGQPASLHRRRVRIPAPEVGHAAGHVFGDPPSAREKNPVVT